MKKIFCALLLYALPVAAQTKPIVVDSSELKSATVNFRYLSQNKHKDVFCRGATPGSAKSVSTGMKFTPHSYTLAKLKLARSTNLPYFEKLYAASKKSCKRLNTITPTPTPSAGVNFDAGGNVTTAGKIAFGIPETLTGNISIGRITVQSYCTCHEERLNYPFPSLRSNIARAPMFFAETDISDATLANITAYLNRFRP